MPTRGFNPFRPRPDAGASPSAREAPAKEPVVRWAEPPHPATLDEESLLRACDISNRRSGGPGGQHRNKVESGVEIAHRPTGVGAHAGERRTVRENRPVAIRRLRLALATEVRCPVPPGDQRSALWRSRCNREGRIVCNPAHHDYPALLAEALDMVWACDLDVSKTALRLACTMSQLVKLVKDHPPAFVLLNEARRARGEHVLK